MMEKAMTSTWVSSRYGGQRSMGPWWLLALVAMLMPAARAEARSKAAKNLVRAVRVAGGGETRDVIIETASEPTFTVFRLSDPMRVVIDVSGGDISKLDGPVNIDDGVVTQVAVQQFNSDGFSIGRLIVGFNHDVSYDVKADGNRIVVRAATPGVQIERAVPPPAAPVDLGAKERLENAKREAAALAEKATAERKAADAAADTAKSEREEAARLAAAAKQAQKEALVAKADAEEQRKKAGEAVERDRAKANEALARAEARLSQLNDAQAKLAVSQAEADRKAAQAEQARKDAVQAATLAEAKHKVRVAELEDQIARAQSEKREAAEALARAAVAKKEADAAQRVALQAKAEADKARSDTDAKLEAIAMREKKAQEAMAALAGAQREVASQKQQLAGAQREVQTEKERLESERVRLEKMQAQLSAREAQLTAEQQAARAKAEQARTVATAPTPRTDAEPTLVSATLPKEAMKSVGLTGVSRAGDGILLALDGNVEPRVERVDDPPRLVVDLVGAERKVKRTTYGVDAPNVRRVRLGEHDGMVRAVIDLASADVEHAVTSDAKGVRIAVRKVKAQKSRPEESAVAAVKETSGIAQLRKVDFNQTGKISRITLALSGEVQTRVDDRSKKAWVLELTGTHVDAALEKSLDTSAYGGVVRLVSTYQASREPQIVNIVVQLQGTATQRLVRDGSSIAWEITGEAKAPALPAIAETEPAAPEIATQRTPQTAGYASAAAAVARSIPAQSTASGRARRVSLNFKDADIVNVIRLIADVTGENIITSEDVKGKVTVRLRNVPWETALDTILKSKGYDKVRSHNILRIAPAALIQGERDAEIARQKSQIEIEEKVIKIVTVNYANATEVVTQVKSLLSTRGTAQTDERTNTIIVEDVRSNIDRLVELVRRLDKQTPQVLIEARIVEASTNFSQDLGVQWGGQAQATAATGNPTGLSFPGDVIVTGANATGGTAGVTTPGNYAVNLPAAITTGGAIGLVFGSAGGSQLLQLRLAALEGRGSGRIISSPRVATLDNRTAKISQGVDIPITVTSAAGANTRFVPANLELEVTPHVTNDGAILMRIHATRNEPNFARTGAFGDPTIERREAQTEVLVNDGDTTVIGGIYTRNTTRQYSQVPVLSQIPVLGWLFKNRTDRDNKSELLIFISPKIVNRSESTVSSGDTMSGG